MKMPILSRMLFGAAFLVFATSCGDQEKTQAEGQAETTTETAAGTETSADKAEVKVNPAHGLPGHRCDLPVGAPLNSNASAQQQTSQNNTSSTVSPIRLDKTPAVNPPHGEPGHDCSVPVGAPLE